MEEEYALTAKGIETIVSIDTLFRRQPHLTIEEIANILGLDGEFEVRILYSIGASAGVIDALEQTREKLGYPDILD